MKKVIVLTKRRDAVAASLVRSLTRGLPDYRVSVLIETGARSSLKKKVLAQIRNIKKHGLIWIPYRLYLAVKGIFFKESASETEDVPPFNLLTQEGIEVKYVTNYHDEALINELKGEEYVLGVVFGTGILSPLVFEFPDNGMINIHQGVIPYYRGQPPGFWELYNDETEVGMTVHCVSSDLDGGDIVYQETLPILPTDNVLSLQVKLDECVVNRLGQVVNDYLSGLLEKRKVNLQEGKVYFKPTIRQVWALEKRLKEKRCNE